MVWWPWGLAHPDRIRRNADARAGDALILGKPLGVGVLSAALKKGLLSEAGYAEMVRYTTQLNRVGPELAGNGGCSCDHGCNWFWLGGASAGNCPRFRFAGEGRFLVAPLHRNCTSLCEGWHQNGRVAEKLA